MRFPASIQNLINQFSELPTVGPKTAERYVFFLLKQSPEKLQEFAQYLAELKEKTTICQQCLAISETNPCLICSNNKRDAASVCVVATTQDKLIIESTRRYNGLYHVLDGLINTIEEVKPEQLNIKQLISRVKNNGIKEIILAFNPTVEGETTVLYLIKILKSYNLKISRLARGLSTGSNIEYADEITLTNAFKYRTDL